MKSYICKSDRRGPLTLKGKIIFVLGWVVAALFSLGLLSAHPVAAWKVWYDDGTGLRIFHSQSPVGLIAIPAIYPPPKDLTPFISQANWDRIPNSPGIQVILVCESKEWKIGHPYRIFYRGADWYWFSKGKIHKSYGDGYPNGKWTPKPHPDARAGLTIDDKVFASYQQQAMDDTTCSVP